MLERPPVEERGDGEQRHERDLHAPRQPGGHDQRVAVHEQAEQQREQGLAQQRADEHLQPAHRDDPPGARVHADEQEDRPEDEQDQEADLEDEQRHRDEEDQQPRDHRGDERAERDAEPRRPVLALEQEERRGVPHRGDDFLDVPGLVRGGVLRLGALLLHVDRLNVEQLRAERLHLGGRRVGGAEHAHQPRLAHERRPQLVGVAVHHGRRRRRTRAPRPARPGPSAAGRRARRRRAGRRTPR